MWQRIDWRPAAVVLLLAAATARASEEPAGASDEQQSAVAALQQEADKLAPLVKSDAVRSFLRATEALPHIETRTVFRNKAEGLAYTADEAAQLPEAERAVCTRHEYDETFYYFTGYGSSLVYARPLDIWAKAADVHALAGKRIFDFGYGSVGHLRLLARNGADAVGVEVEPVFRALYSQPGDQGEVAAQSGPPGKITLIHGKFPAGPDVTRAVGGNYDLVISKNVLKRGYIHPEREADERLLVHLGVDDETFVKALFDILKPGGYALVYNISPAPAPPDKPYIPWADGRFPFERELIEQAGFEVLAWDRDDSETIYDVWFALGYEEGQTREELSKDLFARYTLLRRAR